MVDSARTCHPCEYCSSGTGSRPPVPSGGFEHPAPSTPRPMVDSDDDDYDPDDEVYEPTDHLRKARDTRHECTLAGVSWRNRIKVGRGTG